jgi:hypothetical protein
MASPARRRSRERSPRDPTRTHGVPVTATPTRVAVDGTAVRTDDEWSRSSAATGVDGELRPDVGLRRRPGTGPAPALLRESGDTRSPGESSPVDQAGYRTVIVRPASAGRVDAVDRPVGEGGPVRSRCGSTAVTVRGLVPTGRPRVGCPDRPLQQRLEASTR